MVTASDIVTDDDIRAIAEKVRNKYYIFRRAYRDDDATDINSNSREFPISEFEFEDEFVEVPEGEDYPRVTKDLDTVPAAYTKYGLEVPITDEAVSDSLIDIEMDVNEDLLEAEEQRLDAISFGVLDDNYGNVGEEIGDNDGTIERSDVLEARQELFLNDGDLSNIEMYASGQNMTNLLDLDDFTQASELGDQVIRSGILPEGNIENSPFIGVLSDVPVYLENVGLLDEGEAFVVDTANYGWESTRWNTDVSSYREESNDQDVWKIRDRLAWVSTRADAAVKIEA